MPEQATEPTPQGKETERYEQLELPLAEPVFDDAGTGAEYPVS